MHEMIYVILKLLFDFSYETWFSIHCIYRYSAKRDRLTHFEQILSQLFFGLDLYFLCIFPLRSIGPVEFDVKKSIYKKTDISNI